METALPIPAPAERTRRWRLGALFSSPVLALAIPLLVPLAILFW